MSPTDADPTPRIEAIVPVRGLPAGKTRLAARLDRDQRNALVRAMLADVVAALRDAPSIARVTIVSRDAAAAREAERLGVDFLAEPPGPPDLNGAIVAAQAARATADTLLIVPADVPLLTVAAVEALVAAAPASPAAVIAGGEDGGTTGLLLAPPGLIAPRFGGRSAEAHVRAAEAAGAAVRTVDTPGWALDIDTPDDLRRFQALLADPDADVASAAPATRACLRALGLNAEH